MTTPTPLTGRQVLLINGAHGVYVGMMFAESSILSHGWSLPQGAMSILRAGPDHPDYHEAWAEVLDRAVLQGEYPRTWGLHQTPEGDLYAIRDDWEWAALDLSPRETKDRPIP